MLRAHAKMPINEFIAQLRTYVIALGLSTQVVDCVDRLIDTDEMEDAHAEELREAESRGRESMKNEILGAVSKWLDYQDFRALKDDLIAVIEEIEI